MERIYSPPAADPRGSHFSRVKDLEHSQQWTSLASDINDLERAKMRQHVTSDPRKHMLHRRSMPEPQVTSLIYVEVDTDDYGNGTLTNKSITDNYFLPIGPESNDESVDSWSWKRESDYSPDRNYFGNNNNNEYYDYNRIEESWAANNRPVINREKKNRRNTYNNNLQQVPIGGGIDEEISRGETLERNFINKEKLQSYNGERFDTEETAYRGSRERLHEIFRRNRDLRREFFATVPKISSELTKTRLNTTPEFKDRSNSRGEIHQDTGSGYGSVETLTSQSNNSEISGIQNRRTENSSRASQNSRVSEAPENGSRIMQEVILQENKKNLKNVMPINQSANFKEFDGSVRGMNEGHYHSPSGPLESESAVIPASLELSSRVNPSKSLETPGFDGSESPAPPLPTSEPPSSIFGHQLLISGDSLVAPGPLTINSNPPDPPQRQTSEKKNFEVQDGFLQRDISSSQAYKPESEGLRMLNRFEARIENRKLSPQLIPPSNKSEDFGISKKSYKSMPDLANAGAPGYPRKGIISRLAVNGSTIDLNLTDNDYSRGEFSHLNHENESKWGKSDDKPPRIKFTVSQVRPSLNYVTEPQEIHATRVDLREKSKLSNRRRRVPPPLDLSKVAEALRQETVRQDRRVLRDYSVESTPLRGELVKCKVTDLGGNVIKNLSCDENLDRPRVGAALKTATNLLDLSRNLSRPLPVPIPIRGTSSLQKTPKKSDAKNENKSSQGSARFRSSVVVWCDGNSIENENSVVEKPRPKPAVSTRKSTLEHRKSTGSLIPATGNVFPSVYAPIPYKSPRRYVEGEVTIHYRSPVRTEAKEVLSEAELARRSAENMRRVYQEERRRKYLQELHDIDSRRHTDNFTPSQKSPIPLNRYDDFVDDLSHRSRSQEQTPEPRLVAKALYNFVGQSSRELTFRRGDIIFVRRQVDKNWYEGEHNAMIGLFPFNYVEILPYDGIRTTTTPKKPYEGQARAKFNFVAQTTHELSLVKGDLVVLTRRVDENWYEGRIGNRKGIFPISYVEVLVEPGIRPETPAQNKPVAAPAAHSLLSNGSAGGKLSMGPHHYTPSIPTNTNAVQPHYNSLPRMGGSKLHVAPVNETLHIDTHSEPLRYRALYNYRPQNDDELELKEGDAVYVMEKCDDGWFVGSSQRTGCFGTFPGNYVERL